MRLSFGGKKKNKSTSSQDGAQALNLNSQESPLIGVALLSNGSISKGTAFSEKERDQYKLRGLLPHRVENIEIQSKRELENLQSMNGILQKYIYLQSLANRNLTLFYHLFTTNIELITPIIYTPGLEQVCMSYSRVSMLPNGIYISVNDKGSIKSILENWPEKDIKAILVTDGENILGLGDIGINAMAHSITAAQIYSTYAGFESAHCLPVCLDVGTDNEKLLDDDLYQGVKSPRLQGKKYHALISEFLAAAKSIYGNVFFQFDGLCSSNSSWLLSSTNAKYNIYVNDIQGTAVIVLSGLLGALKQDGVPSKLSEHRILVYGAGAEYEIGNLLAFAKTKEDPNLSMAEARNNIWLCDTRGLIHSGRSGLEKGQSKFAHQFVEEGACFSFYYAVEEIKPTILIGLSGIQNSFFDDIFEMIAVDNEKPIIFALSTPLSNCECTAEEAYVGTNYKCIFVSPNEYPPVENNTNNQLFTPNKPNLSLVFPGLALGIISSGATVISDEILFEAAVAMATLEELETGCLYPTTNYAKEISMKIAESIANYIIAPKG